MTYDDVAMREQGSMRERLIIVFFPQSLQQQAERRLPIMTFPLLHSQFYARKAF